MLNIFNKISYILIFILPFTLISGPAIPDISITLVGIFFLIQLFFLKQFSKIYNYKWVKISFIFWFFLICISFFAENKFLSFADSIIFIRIILIPIFIYFWILVDENRVKYLTFVVFIAVIFVCCDSIYQFLQYDPQSGFGSDIFGHIPDFYGRLTGPFLDLIPGAYVSKFSLIGLAFLLIFLKKGKLQNLTIILYLSLIGLVTFISGERMSLATFLLALVLLILFFKTRRLVIMISILFIFFSIFAANKLHPIYNDYKVLESTPYHLGLKIEKNFKCNNNKQEICKKIIDLQPSFLEVIKNFDKSAYGQIYALGLKMWKDHPIQGVGLNNFTYLCENDSRYQNSIQNYNCVTHPHNIYLQWLIESGIFGLLIFLFYLTLIFYFIYKKDSFPFNILALATLVILFWPLMSTGSLLKNWMGVSSFYIIGICLSLTKIKQKI